MRCLPGFPTTGRRAAGVVLTAAVLLTACSSATGPSGVALHFTASQASVANQIMPPSATVVVTTAGIEITGYLTTPTPCYHIGASHQVADTTLVVALTATSSAPTCAQTLATFQFVAAVTGVPATVTHVRVTQTGAVAGFSTVLVDQAVPAP